MTRYNQNDKLIIYSESGKHIIKEILNYISKHLLRADIYLIICIDNNYFELIIETDEYHHTSTKPLYDKQHKYDYYKDKYAIKNGISLVRINIFYRFSN